MSTRHFPPRPTLGYRARAIARRLTFGGATLTLLFLPACGGPGPGPDENSGTLSGVVRAVESQAALADATVSVGTREAMSDENGHYELTELSVGTATVRATRPGYMASEEAVTISAGANTHDFALTAQEIFTFGSYSIYVPAGVGPLRGAIISLGGGVTTSGFVTGGPLEPGNPTLEQSLQALGASLRTLAKTSRVALLGTTIHSLANSGASDAALFSALASAGEASGHAELTDAPVLTFGLDAGGQESIGLASRAPTRTVGVLVRVPTSVPGITDPSVLAVPTFVMLSGQDNPTVNASVQATFSANRSHGGLWALAVEPGVQHAEATAQGNAANVSWIQTALALRLPATAGDPLVALDESSGWLGNQTTLDIAAWADYAGDRAAASWLLNQSAATSWKILGTSGGGGD